jgi:predicted deacylase
MAALLKTRRLLRVSDEVELPVLEAAGTGAGRRLVVTAGVHGDEYEGVRALYELFEEIEELRGTLTLAPVVNPQAHRAVSRTNPLDGENLARVFPGSAESSISRQIASVVTRELIEGASVYIDLHSGGVRYAMPSMVGYWLGDARARDAAMAFGAPVVWGHPVIEPGRTISVAKERGIPFLYVEAWGAGRIRGEDLRMMKRGVVNVMRHLGMMDGAVEVPAPPLRLTGVGNTDDGISAAYDGFLILEVALLDSVDAGVRLGKLVDLQGVTVEEYYAPRAGVVALTHEMPIVTKGDTLFLLADIER